MKFETGQDSYLDADSQAAQDNHRYQELFGGESMVVMFTMPEGTTVVDLFTPDNLARFESLGDTLHEPGSGVENLITPVTALQWTQDMVTSGAATRIIAAATEREPDATAVALREDDLALTFRGWRQLGRRHSTIRSGGGSFCSTTRASRSPTTVRSSRHPTTSSSCARPS